MRQTRSVGLLAVLVVVPFFVLGCGRAADSNHPTATANADGEQVGGEAPFTLAMIPKSTGGEFWETVEVGANDAAKELGVDIKWEGALTETDIAEQKKIIENMVNMGVDGIALAPLNAKAMQKDVENAVAAGIPVVIFDSAVEGTAHTSFVATDNPAGGGLGAKHLAENIHGDSKKVILLRFIQGTASTEDRARGFLEAAKQAGFDVVTDAYIEDATVTGAKKTATNVLEGYVENGELAVDGIFACNLTATLGMAAALDDLRKSGVTSEAVFVGFDSSPRLVEELQNGSIDALIVQSPKKMGRLAIETLVKHLRKEPVEPFIDTGVQVVTAERLKSEPEIRELVGLPNGP
ncbi:MAG: substrate-binding domain-containing protein [Pirellulales bacterium]